MYRNISAEFQTIDDADLVARKIRESVEGVKRITFSYKNEKVRPTTTPGNFFDFMGTSNMGITGAFLPYDFQYYETANFNNFVSVRDALSDDYGERIEGNKGTIINIVCKDSEISDVEKKLISYGGLNISK